MHSPEALAYHAAHGLEAQLRRMLVTSFAAYTVRSSAGRPWTVTRHADDDYEVYRVGMTRSVRLSAAEAAAMMETPQ